MQMAKYLIINADDFGYNPQQTKAIDELMRGGLITSTILTLFVLPAISQLLLKGRHKHHEAGEYSDVDQFGSELPQK